MLRMLPLLVVVVLMSLGGCSSDEEKSAPAPGPDNSAQISKLEDQVAELEKLMSEKSSALLELEEKFSAQDQAMTALQLSLANNGSELPVITLALDTAITDELRDKLDQANAAVELLRGEIREFKAETNTKLGPLLGLNSTVTDLAGAVEDLQERVSRLHPDDLTAQSLETQLDQLEENLQTTNQTLAAIQTELANHSKNIPDLFAILKSLDQFDREGEILAAIAALEGRFSALSQRLGSESSADVDRYRDMRTLVIGLQSTLAAIIARLRREKGDLDGAIDTLRQTLEELATEHRTANEAIQQELDEDKALLESLIDLAKRIVDPKTDLSKSISSREVFCTDAELCHPSVGMYIAEYIRAGSDHIGLENGEARNKTCSATLVAKDVILTAKHCVPDKYLSKGFDCTGKGGVRFPLIYGNGKKFAPAAAGCGKILNFGHYANEEHRDGDWVYIQLAQAIDRPIVKINHEGIGDNQKVAFVGIRPIIDRSFVKLYRDECKALQNTYFHSEYAQDKDAVVGFFGCGESVEGMSGSAILNEDGDLVGIHAAHQFEDLNKYKKPDGTYKLFPLRGRLISIDRFPTPIKLGVNAACIPAVDSTDSDLCPEPKSNDVVTYPIAKYYDEIVDNFKRVWNQTEQRSSFGYGLEKLWPEHFVATLHADSDNLDWSGVEARNKGIYKDGVLLAYTVFPYCYLNYDANVLDVTEDFIVPIYVYNHKLDSNFRHQVSWHRIMGKMEYKLSRMNKDDDLKIEFKFIDIDIELEDHLKTKLIKRCVQ